MKLDAKNLNELLSSEFYEGIEGYLIDDNKNKLNYHIYMVVRLSDNSAVIITKPSPVAEDAKFEIYEFNGNKVLDHGSTRIKLVDNTSSLYERLVKQFENKEFVRQ